MPPDTVMERQTLKKSDRGAAFADPTALPTSSPKSQERIELPQEEMELKTE